MTYDLNRLLELSGRKVTIASTKRGGNLNERKLREHIGKLREHLEKLRGYLVEVERAPNFFVPQNIGPGGVPNSGTDQSIVKPPENAGTDTAMTDVVTGIPREPSDLNQSQTATKPMQDI